MPKVPKLPKINVFRQLNKKFFIKCKECTIKTLNPPIPKSLNPPIPKSLKPKDTLKLSSGQRQEMYFIFQGG